ncbi:Alkyl hydroperoxide reductase subunit C-like protein [Leucobacter sp. 7(1)]|uniref:MerR family transcriptional regulator n=1 Tax=Leucobacter sp. 7(1) TaxID=1255613 RepID=UPI00097E8425|nr:MerR family transcriptional regulator [Leucobacter sp. 7(1)]SJN12294.1 Alkyl hydroperoxide reductase subunit C-like protein [Leucobacter sp. 7(1)]
MRIGTLAAQAETSIKAIRYYEQIGLISPERDPNGYRSYTPADLRAVREIRALQRLGIPPGRSAPFLECLQTGHEHGDECVSSLAVYRDAIAELDGLITELSARRSALQRSLDGAADRQIPAASPNLAAAPHDFSKLPEGLPVPADDGAAAHLPGASMPDLTLVDSAGSQVSLAALGPGRTVIYLYPLTGRPGVDLPDGWDAIPGARGCSTQACSFRDHFTELAAAGVARVYGLSSQDSGYQAEVTARLRLPFTMLADPDFALGDALTLPTFAAPGHARLYSRLTLVVTGGRIEHVFYPIFPPNTHAEQVLAWLRVNPAPRL